jgi:hypothetical protein
MQKILTTPQNSTNNNYYLGAFGCNMAAKNEACHDFMILQAEGTSHDLPGSTPV